MLLPGTGIEFSEKGIIALYKVHNLGYILFIRNQKPQRRKGLRKERKEKEELTQRFRTNLSLLTMEQNRA
jgi:hypothetical protein